VPSASLTDAEDHDEPKRHGYLTCSKGTCGICVSRLLNGLRGGWSEGILTANIISTLRDELRQGL
jgi:hypothetical protein